jgi:hypothetical protein
MTLEEAIANAKEKGMGEVVVEAIVKAWPEQAAEILPAMERNHFGGHWYFNRWGMYVGVEDDGYIHT